MGPIDRVVSLVAAPFILLLGLICLPLYGLILLMAVQVGVGRLKIAIGYPVLLAVILLWIAA